MKKPIEFTIAETSTHLSDQLGNFTKSLMEESTAWTPRYTISLGGNLSGKLFLLTETQEPNCTMESKPTSQVDIIHLRPRRS